MTLPPPDSPTLQKMCEFIRLIPLDLRRYCAAAESLLEQNDPEKPWYRTGRLRRREGKFPILSDCAVSRAKSEHDTEILRVDSSPQRPALLIRQEGR
jgi:hypothetical protein